MKIKIYALLTAVSLLFSGCSLMDGSYVSVTPHQVQRPSTQTAVISASDNMQLREALTDMIAEGRESAAINVSDYPASMVESGMASAVRHAMKNDPIGAYAVEEIQYELGTSAGQPAVAVRIEYGHSRIDIQRITRMKNLEEAQPLVAKALRDCDAEVVMLAEEYSEKDFVQMVEAYALENPQLVMEIPQVSVNTYGAGTSRVVEVIFTYQTGRDILRQMQTQVKPVFDAATLYVSDDSSSQQKYNQLYAFLMERFDYQVETSITPAYSLLRNGIGDSRAFATVYAAMCRAAGLECLVVTGTRDGELRTWNMVLDDVHYYHVDLLHCNERRRYMQKTDGQMQEYDWNRDAYPACSGAQAEALPTTEPTEETLPEAEK